MPSVTRGLLLPLVTLSLILMAACGGTATASQADEPEAAASAASADADGDGGGGGGGDTGGGGVDLCAVLSEDEVSDATDTDITDSTGASSGGISSCNYNTATAAVAGTTYTTTDAGVDPGQMFDANFEAAGAEEIDGIGDGAVLVGDADFPILFVLVRGNLLAVSVLADNLDAGGKRDATIELARLAVDRLP